MGRGVEDPGSKFGGSTRFPMETENTRGADGLPGESRCNDGCCLISVPHMGALRDTFH